MREKITLLKIERYRLQNYFWQKPIIKIYMKKIKRITEHSEVQYIHICMDKQGWKVKILQVINQMLYKIEIRIVSILRILNNQMVTHLIGTTKTLLNLDEEWELELYSISKSAMNYMKTLINSVILTNLETIKGQRQPPNQLQFQVPLRALSDKFYQVTFHMRIYNTAKPKPRHTWFSLQDRAYLIWLLSMFGSIFKCMSS